MGLEVDIIFYVCKYSKKHMCVFCVFVSFTITYKMVLVSFIYSFFLFLLKKKLFIFFNSDADL